MTDERIRPPWWLKPLNKALMGAQKVRLPIFGKQGLPVLTVIGRKSGKPRSTPVSPMTVDGRRYVVGGFPGADWVRNAQANPNISLCIPKLPSAYGKSAGKAATIGRIG